MRRANGTGTIVKLSGNRRRPFEVRVNTRINEWGYPVYDVLGRYADRLEADIALAEYNKSPFDVNRKKITFAEVYNLWYDWKYKTPAKTYSRSSIDCTKGAFSKCQALHNTPILEIKTDHMQRILDNHELSHAYLEHIGSLFKQVFKYAMEYDIIEKDYSRYLCITKAEDDKPGVPFTRQEIAALWQQADKIPYVDVVLILIYTGWRISELLGLKTEDVDLEAWIMTGGVKTTAGKNRIVPIHSGIRALVGHYHNTDHAYFLADSTGNRPMTKTAFYKVFSAVLESCGIQSKHTPHDCRHLSHPCWILLVQMRYALTAWWAMLPNP